MRVVRWLGGVVWVGSWYLMYLEITRWRHVKPSLAFNSAPDPVTGVRPRPGQPLIMLYVACVTAPFVVMARPVVRLLTHRSRARLVDHETGDG